MTRLGPEARRLCAERRLSILQLAEVLGNVSEACRQSGTDRRSFYRWLRRFGAAGLAGLEDTQPARSSRAARVPSQVAAEVERLSLLNPRLGCGSLARVLAERGVSISSPTVQRILIARGLGSLSERAERLEQEALAGLALSDDQRRAVEACNPAFTARQAGTLHPGQVLVQDALLVAQAPLLGRLYLHAAVDASCALAFARLETRRGAGPARALLEERVLPFYRERGLAPGRLRTGPGPAFVGGDRHPFQRLLREHGIVHLVSGPAPERGVLLRFERAVLEGFVRAAAPADLRPPLQALEARFEAWLGEYNARRPWPGYPNRGLPPLEMLLRLLDAGPEAASGTRENGGAANAPPPR